MRPPPRHWQPILTVLLVTPFLTELLSNNLLPSFFFRPITFFCLATIAYGFPVLLLREFAVRRNLGIPAMILLGLAYGMYNEGILAKTFYLAQNVPVNTFDNYGFIAGIAVPWAITISVWHSTHAFLYPLLLTYWLFPGQRQQAWLSRTSIIWIATPTVLLSTLIFFTRSSDRAPALWPHYLLMLAGIGCLLWLAARWPAVAQLADNMTFRVRPIVWGGLYYLALLLVPIIFSKARLPTPLFYGYFILIGVLIFRRLGRHSVVPVTTALLFAAGDQIVLVAFNIMVSMSHTSLQELIANILFMVVFLCLVFWLRYRMKHSLQPVVLNPGT